jgi:hypothetical protein
MKQINKEYPKGFLLEPTKLTRIIDKIHERLEDHQPTMKRDQFDVFLTANRHEQINKVEDVLSLDNSRKQQITRLIISCSAGKKVAARLDDEIQVDFGGKTTASTSNIRVVAISIRSDDAGWANRTLSELEEQVERTWLSSQPVLLLAALLVIALTLVGLLLTSNLAFRYDDSRTMWLRETDMDRVERLVGDDKVLTEEGTRELETLKLRNLLKTYKPKQSPKEGRSRRIAVVGIPLILIIICVLFLMATCYPKAVFLWGDEVTRYASILQRRKVLWGVIIGITPIGVLANFLFAGITSWLFP